jgi:hypothetical protein
MTEDNYNKDYYQANKTYFSQYMKEYYAHNKETYLRKVNCPVCGKLMAKTNVKRHQKSHLCVPPEQQKKFFIPDIPKNPIHQSPQSGTDDSTVQETLQCVVD